LRLDFRNPLLTPLQLFVELVPTQPFGPRPVLALPSPVDTASTEGLVAFRLDGIQADVVQHRGMTGTEPEKFTANWQEAGIDDPGVPVRAYSFRRTGGGVPYLQLEQKPWRLPVNYSQTLTWLFRAIGRDKGSPARSVKSAELRKDDKR